MSLVSRHFNQDVYERIQRDDMMSRRMRTPPPWATRCFRQTAAETSATEARSYEPLAAADL